MINSMTGYGRAIGERDGYSITVELKSVNHRFFEFSAKAPRVYEPVDDAPAYQAPPEQPAAPAPRVPAFSVPRDGAARWEAQLLCLYALNPPVRTRIYEAMRGETWSLPLFARLMDLMVARGFSAKPSELVYACMEECPESEAIWNMSVPTSEDAAELEATVGVMARERKKAAIEDRIRVLERRVKYENPAPEEASYLFQEITTLQKELSELRKM